VEDSLDELGRIRKTTLDFGGESRDKISVLTKTFIVDFFPESKLSLRLKDVF